MFEVSKAEHLLLPHEMELVNYDYAILVERQREHGQLMGEAMEQSSETFHDNAPAEIIRDDQEVLMRAVKPILFIFRHHVFVDYPDPDSEAVALGTRASISINGGEVFEVDIIGYRDAVRDDDVEQVSYLSGLGSVLFGHEAGETVDAEINDVVKSVTIAGVDQLSLRALYQSTQPSTATT